MSCMNVQCNILIYVALYQSIYLPIISSIGLNSIGDRGAEHVARALEENKSESVKEI